MTRTEILAEIAVLQHVVSNANLYVDNPREDVTRLVAQGIQDAALVKLKERMVRLELM